MESFILPKLQQPQFITVLGIDDTMIMLQIIILRTFIIILQYFHLHEPAAKTGEK